MVEAERQRHRITRIIAATRFPFVDQPEDSWPPCYKTIVNDEEHRFGLLAPWGEVVYPSIVILNCGGGVQELGMVESAEMAVPERLCECRSQVQEAIRLCSSRVRGEGSGYP